MISRFQLKIDVLDPEYEAEKFPISHGLWIFKKDFKESFEIQKGDTLNLRHIDSSFHFGKVSRIYGAFEEAARTLIKVEYIEVEGYVHMEGWGRLKEIQERAKEEGWIILYEDAGLLLKMVKHYGLLEKMVRRKDIKPKWADEEE